MLNRGSESSQLLEVSAFHSTSIINNCTDDCILSMSSKRVFIFRLEINANEIKKASTNNWPSINGCSANANHMTHSLRSNEYEVIRTVLCDR